MSKELEELLRKHRQEIEAVRDFTKEQKEKSMDRYSQSRKECEEAQAVYACENTVYGLVLSQISNLSILNAPAPELPAATPATGHGMKDSDWNILKHKHPDTQKDVLESYKQMAKDYARLEELEKQVGQIGEGQHPDEIKPRAETWLQERANWQSEVDTLRAKIAEQELIIHGIEEGADEWRMKCDDLQHQLNKLQSPQPDKEPESQREEKEDGKIWNGVISFIEGRMKNNELNERKDQIISHLFYHYDLKLRPTPTSAKSDKEIEELAEVYVPISKDEVESVLKSERYINGWTYGNTVGWLKPIRIPAAMIEMHKAK